MLFELIIVSCFVQYLSHIHLYLCIYFYSSLFLLLFSVFIIVIIYFYFCFWALSKPIFESNLSWPKSNRPESHLDHPISPIPLKIQSPLTQPTRLAKAQTPNLPQMPTHFPQAQFAYPNPSLINLNHITFAPGLLPTTQT